MRVLILTLTVFLFAGLALSGCNTIEGMGRDIEQAGESIQNM